MSLLCSALHILCLLGVVGSFCGFVKGEVLGVGEMLSVVAPKGGTDRPPSALVFPTVAHSQQVSMGEMLIQG